MGQLEQIHQDIRELKQLMSILIERLPPQETNCYSISIPNAAKEVGVHSKTMNSWVQRNKVNWIWNKNKTRKEVLIDEKFEKYRK